MFIEHIEISTLTQWIFLTACKYLTDNCDRKEGLNIFKPVSILVYI